jgi:type IV pilus assembly protein PilQ
MTWLLAGAPHLPAVRPAEIPEGGASQSVVPAKTAEKPGSVSQILITPGSRGEVTIDVATTKSPTFHVYRFDHPDRLVVDVKGMTNAVRQHLIPVSSAVVKEVRVGQFRRRDPEVVRIVADLSGNPLFDARASKGGVRLEVKPRPTAIPPVASPAAAPALETVVKRTAAPAAASTPETSVPPAAAPTPETAVKRAAAPAASSTHKTPLSRVGAPAASSTLKTAAKRGESGPDYNVTLPASEGRRDAAAAPRQTPQETTPEALKADKAAQVLSAGKTSNPTATPGAVPVGPAPPGEESPAYTGEQISLNLKDVDLKDFFRLIHEISGLNILVDPNVTGSVTMVVDNVPWDQALDIVLKDNGLGKVLEGNVLRIARLDTLMVEQDTANKLAAQRLDAAPLVTLFRPVNYATATDIAALLKAWTGGGLTKRGSVQVDKRSNMLIISDVASQIPIIDGILAKLDTKTKQVAIEARIVLATSSFQRTLSAALVGAAANTSGSTIGAAQTGSGASITPGTTTTPPTFTIPQNASSGFGVVAITNFSQRYLIDATISAAEIRSQAKTISRPSIITQNNVEGMVQQGTQIPVQTSINNTISVQYVDATLKLTVTPQVTDDGHIFLKINVQNATPGTIIVNASVSINIQQATTQVLVPDGGTVVFGGVTVTQRQNSVTQIPLLGSIPILGNLFKSTNVQDSDQELLFFVSPRLLTS